MTRLRVASPQYFIRPLQTFEQFRNQVVGLVETADRLFASRTESLGFAAVIEWLNPDAPENSPAPWRTHERVSVRPDAGARRGLNRSPG